jgi:hypothetical protein
MAAAGHCSVYLHRHIVAGREAPAETWGALTEGLGRLSDHDADIDSELDNGWCGSPVRGARRSGRGRSVWRALDQAQTSPARQAEPMNAFALCPGAGQYIAP